MAASPVSRAEGATVQMDDREPRIDLADDASPADPTYPPGFKENGQLGQGTILQGKRLAVVFTSLLMCLLLIALDQTILATALPRIASDFKHFSLQGWVSASFILTQGAFVLPFGQFLRIYVAKWVLLSSVLVFEIGSLLAGVAPNIYVLIVGRAISGVGAAGMYTSGIQILAQVTLLKDRPKLFGLFGAVFGIASIVGPLIGGALTDHITWRWCFYINLPIGGLAAAIVLFSLKASPPLGSEAGDRSSKSLWEQTRRMDWAGGLLCLGSITALVLALQWGGNQKPWSSSAVVISFVIFGVSALALGVWQWWLGDEGMVPFSILRVRSALAIVHFNDLCRFSFLILTYFIPIFYQVTRNHSATKSGIDLLPLMLSVVISVILVGQVVSRIGRYWPFLFVGPLFTVVGCVLLYTITEHTQSAKLIGYQILAGVGIGFTLQNATLAMQAEFRDDQKHLAQASGLAVFGQFFGGTVGLAVAQAVFSSQLRKNMLRYAPAAPFKLVQQSPLAIYTDLDHMLIAQVVHAYVKSLNMVYIVCVPAAGLSVILAVFIKNLDISPVEERQATDMAKQGSE